MPLSCSHCYRTSSPTFQQIGSTLEGFPCKCRTCLTSHVLQLLRGRTSPPAPGTPRGQLSHLPQLARGGGGHISLTHAITWHTRGEPFGLAHLCPCQEDLLYCAVWVRWNANSFSLMSSGPALPPTTGNESG